MLNCKIIKLDNGLTVVMDFVPTVNSATLGMWSNIGSRIETPENNGICHFLEHMVFKGTTNRSSFAISDDLESKGGYMNAWTSKEKTAWYAKVLKEDVPLGVDIILDILRNSTFPTDELAKEKGVILEEIKMYLDDPSDLAHNLYDKLCYQGSSLSYPIIGNAENINKFTVSDFKEHMEKYYHPEHMVFVISGNFDEKIFMDTLQEKTHTWQNKTVNLGQNSPQQSWQQGIIIKKEIEQTTLVYGVNAVSYMDENYHKYNIANAILGGGMSSRLFTEIREKRGLAYSVNSFLSSYKDCGTWAVQVGCSKENAPLVVNLIKEEVNKAITTLTEKELIKAKNQLKSSILMSLESTYSRSSRLASNILNYGEVKDLNEIINKINTVDIKDIVNIFNKLNSDNNTIAIVSNSDIKI